MKKLIYLVTVVLFCSCSVTQYHTAKPLKKGEKQIVVGLDSYIAPTVQIIAKQGINNNFVSALPINPNLQFNWGTKKNKDRTISLSVLGQLSYAVNYGLVNNEDIKFSMSVRPEVGLLAVPLQNQEVSYWAKTPLLFTKEFGEKSSFTFSPSLLFAYTGYKYAVSKHQNVFFSSSFAFHYGNKGRLVVGFSFINFKNNFSQQLSIGYIFKFGSVK